MTEPVRIALACVLVVLLGPLAAHSKVEVVGDKCVIVDGKPFFAIGVYNAWDPGGQHLPPDFATLAQAGFNLVHSYAWEGQAEYDGQYWLDAAREHGLMALGGLYRSDVYEMDWTRSIARIERYRDHPALLAWHVMDEPNWDRVDTECYGQPIDGKPGSQYMPAAYEMIKQHDPNHPVTTVTVDRRQIRQFMPSVDIMQTDYYCIPPIPQTSYYGTGFFGIKRWVDVSREASGGTKPFWFVCEAWDYGKDKAKYLDVPEEWQRFPTQRELRTMTYTAVASGARGILYYSLHLVMDEGGRRGGDREMYLGWLTSVTRELHQLYPLLTADTPELIQENNHVVAMVKSDGQDIYVIAANYERKPTEVVIQIPGIQRATAEVMFGEGSANVLNAELNCSLEAIESRVYRIRCDEQIVRYPQH